ncbi:hypothetical protein D3C73_1487580 [compost metagenome]
MCNHAVACGWLGLRANQQFKFHYLCNVGVDQRRQQPGHYVQLKQQRLQLGEDGAPGGWPELLRVVFVG